MKHRILPMPNSPLVAGEGRYSFAAITQVDLGGFDADCIAAFALRTGLSLEEKGASEASLVLTKNTELAEEEHTLHITPSGIQVEAATEQGVIWALASLYQLMENKSAPCVQLHDGPKYQHRGLMLDCARHFFAVDEVKKVIEQLSLVKINTFHWHLSDDQGFRIECESFPQIHANQDYYTKVQIRDVVAFAKQRGVSIIPEIDMPGHTSAIVAAMPQLSCHNKEISLKTQGGIFKVTICPGKEETYTFVTKMLDEVCELFESPYFHIGGDESPTLEWETCDDCKKLMQENGATSAKWLQSYFTKRIVEHLRKKGKKPVVWNDFLDCPDALQDADVQYWIEFQKESSLAPYIKKGGKTVFSNMPETYFDYPCALIPLEKVYNFTPKVRGKSYEKDSNTKGVEACVWTERIPTPERLGEMVFPRAFALAEAGWTEKRDYKSFEERVKPLLEEMAKQGMNFTPEAGWNPQGKERRRLIVEFFKMFKESMPEPSEVQPGEHGGENDKKESGNMIPMLLGLFGITDVLLIPELMKAFSDKK